MRDGFTSRPSAVPTIVKFVLPVLLDQASLVRLDATQVDDDVPEPAHRPVDVAVRGDG
jgi:hypothetical protein